MKMYILVNKDLQDYDLKADEITLREPFVIGNTYECNGMFQYLENGFFGYPTLEDLFNSQRQWPRFQVIEFDETTGLPLPLPKNEERILEVEMLEHEGFTPCQIPGKAMCMKIKVLREIHYNPETFEVLPK